MPDRPTGTVTFLFTDVEGSSRLWTEHGEAMGSAMARHDDLVRGAVESRGGYVFSTGGDSFAAAFSTSHDAVAAAVDAQLGLMGEEWGETPIRMRMAVHTGEADERDGDYFGPALTEVARLVAAAHGGQIVATTAAAQVIGGDLPEGAGFADLGEVRLRDVDLPVGVFQVSHPDLGVVFPPLAGLVETPNNLPHEVTSFVGRDRELGEIADLVRDSRLVTLTGAGGSGKTRLALRFAVGALDDYPDGVWFADLAVIDDEVLLPGTVAAAVGVTDVAGQVAVDRLVERLGHRKVLLVLDNCEHVLDAAASLTSDVLGRTGAVQVLATSRQPLGTAGEHRYVVPTLDAPSDPTTDPDAACGYAAVRLFADRARTVRHGFEVTSDNAAAVGRVCRRLDGLPLALELAAARLNILSPRELEQRLDDRFALLGVGSRAHVDRHRTLTATLEWSYDLLTAEEQTLLNRLSVFAGGFTLDAAEDVCGGDGIQPGRVLDLAAGLVDKSLLVAYQGTVGRRFRFLETVHEYAAARLVDSGDRERTAERHAGHFQRLAVDSYDRLWGSDEIEVLDRLDEEWPNLRRSFEWHLDEGRTQDGQMMVGSLRSFYWRCYHQTEGLQWGRRFIDADPTPGPGRARALNFLAVQSRSAESNDLWDETIDLYRRYESKKELAGALTHACLSAMRVGDWDTARRHIVEALELAREAGDPVILLMALSNASAQAMVDNDPAQALAFEEESLDWAIRSESPQMIASRFVYVGVTRRFVGDLDGAEEALIEAQRLEAKLGERYADRGLIEWQRAQVALDRHDTEAAVEHLLAAHRAVQPLKADSGHWKAIEKPLLEWARIAVAHGEHDAAVTLLGATEAYLTDPETWVYEYPPHQATEIETTLNTARTHLDPPRLRRRLEPRPQHDLIRRHRLRHRHSHHEGCMTGPLSARGIQ